MYLFEGIIEVYEDKPSVKTKPKPKRKSKPKSKKRLVGEKQYPINQHCKKIHFSKVAFETECADKIEVEFNIPTMTGLKCDTCDQMLWFKITK